jgi:hypothetical protein
MSALGLAFDGQRGAHDSASITELVADPRRARAASKKGSLGVSIVLQAARSGPTPGMDDTLRPPLHRDVGESSRPTGEISLVPRHRSSDRDRSHAAAVGQHDRTYGPAFGDFPLALS